MTVDEALIDVHRHFCAADGTHDDVCVALIRLAGRIAEVEDERNRILDVASRDNAALARIRALLWDDPIQDLVSGQVDRARLRTHVRVREILTVLDGVANGGDA